ncbi:MAG: hypothetical protein DHS20C15_13980 [Planctomycetota bacterium]|nr:MAG: hypothetical protein DHS20C15_13980 [Planctomycetota bacterium]
MKLTAIAVLFLAAGLPSCARSMVDMRMELAGAHMKGELATTVAQLVHEEGQRGVIASTSYCARFPTLAFDGRLHQLFMFDAESNQLRRIQVGEGHVFELVPSSLLRDGESFARLRTRWSLGGIIVSAELLGGHEPQFAMWFPYFIDGGLGPRVSIGADAASLENYAARILPAQG